MSEPPISRDFRGRDIGGHHADDDNGLAQKRAKDLLVAGNSGPLPPAYAEHMTQRISAVAYQRLHDKRQRPESRVFPAATFIDKKPAAAGGL